MSIDKNSLRIEVREKLKAIPRQEVENRSISICDDIINAGLIGVNNKILFYKALSTEVNVDKLIDYALSIGTSVYLPRVNGLDMEIVEYGQGFTSGAYGILEPIGDSVKYDMDIVILPLLGVTLDGKRLGKGKGYYDRYLANSSAYKVAVAFKEQVLQDIPTECHDIKADKVFIG